jgi:MFS family permease
MTASQRSVLWTTCLSHGLIHVFELSVPALLVLIQQEFGVGDLSMGEVVTLYGLLFGLGALPAGYLVDRVGSRVLMVACLWGSSVGLLGMALSPSLLSFSASAAFMGLGLSIYHPAGTALITHALPPTGRVFALHGMAGNTGVASATVIAGTLGALVGWRWALGLLAAVGILLGLRALTLPDAAARPETNGRSRAGGSWPEFVLLLIAAAFMGMVYRGMTTFLPKFFALRYAPEAPAGAAVGGALTTAALMVGLLGMYAAGRLADSGVRPAWVFLAGALFQTPFLVALGFAGGPVLVPLAMGVAFFHFLTQPVGNQMVARFTPPELRGLGYGIYFFFTFGAGSLGALLSGWVSEKFDLARAFPVLAIVLVPAVLVSLLLALLGNRRAVDSPTPDPEPTIL